MDSLAKERLSRESCLYQNEEIVLSRGVIKPPPLDQAKVLAGAFKD